MLIPQQPHGALIPVDRPANDSGVGFHGVLGICHRISPQGFLGIGS
jgi:hypothetical protein